MKVPIFFLTLLLAIPAAAQQQGSRTRVVPPANVAAGRAAPSQPEPQSLKENHVIRLEGTTSTGQEIDLGLTGIGPEFMTDHIFGEDNNAIATCDYTVTEEENGTFVIRYRFGMRVRVPSVKQVALNVPRLANYQTEQVITVGVARCRLDEPVVIKKGKDHSLSLTISKAGAAAKEKK